MVYSFFRKLQTVEKLVWAPLVRGAVPVGD